MSAPAGVKKPQAPAPKPEPERLPLAIEFEALPVAEQHRRVKIAEFKARRGTCYLCAWIVKKIEKQEFPREAKKAHLMLCADPDAAWNREAAQEASAS